MPTAYLPKQLQQMFEIDGIFFLIFWEQNDEGLRLGEKGMCDFR